MAAITITAPIPFDLLAFFTTDPDLEGEVEQATDTLIVIRYPDGTADEFHGSFLYSGDGAVDGTIDAYRMLLNGVTQIRIDGIAISIADAVAAGETQSPDDDLALLAQSFTGGDTMLGNALDDRLNGFAGDDTITGRAGNDELQGGGGHDVLFGGGGDDWLFGGAGNDRQSGGTGGDLLSGGAGADTLSGQDGHDSLIGGIDDDHLSGGIGSDLLSGGPGADMLFGQNGHDELIGSGGDDVLSGGSGADTLIGGPGNDRLSGGTGADIFGFTAATESAGNLRDTIVDFLRGVDKIDLGAIDADEGTAGNQAFQFIGSEAFSAVGQLGFADGVLSGDTDGDLVADFWIAVTNLSEMDTADFIL